MEKVAPIFRPWQAVRKCVRVDSVLTSTRNIRNTGKSGSFEKSCFVCGWLHEAEDLLAAGILGHGLGSFTHGVFGQLTGQEETDGSLDFTRSDRGSLVVVSETRCFLCNPLEDIVHKRVHDAHGLA